MATYTDQEILDKIREAIYDAVSDGFAMLMIGGRQTSRLSLRELRDMEAYYQRRVAAASRKRVLLADVSAGDS